LYGKQKEQNNNKFSKSFKKVLQLYIYNRYKFNSKGEENMGEKNEVKVRLSTVVCVFIILVLVVALGVVYYFGFVANKAGDTKNDSITNITENKTEISTVVGSSYVWEEYPQDFRKELDVWIGNRHDESMFSENTPVTLYSLSKLGFTWGGNPFSDYIGHYILADGDNTGIQEWDSNYSQYDKHYGNEKVNLEKYTKVITYKTAIFNEIYLRNVSAYEDSIEGRAKAQYADLISEEKDYHYTDMPEDRKFYYEIPSMLVMNGNNTSEEAYKNNARAKKIKVIVNNEKEFVFILKDTNAVQVFDLNYKQNTIEKPVNITVEVLETYAGEKTQDIYISDMQFSINSNIPQGR